MEIREYRIQGFRAGPIDLLQEFAYELSQKYKEGKFIIELAHMVKDNGWEKDDESALLRLKRRSVV